MKKLFIRVALLIILPLSIAEVVLRLQQIYGPLYDLKFENINFDTMSDGLHHKPLKKNKVKFSGKEMYGKYDGFEYEINYNSEGVRINKNRSIAIDGTRCPSILFMGDSFVQGYDDDNTIPQHVWRFFRDKNICISTLNAGWSSYSPSIFIPQAKRLIPIFNPDYVVVIIDETDFYDDYVRYRNLIVRDDTGRNIGVKKSPIAYEFNMGFFEIKEQFFYFVRLIYKIYHIYINKNIIIKKYRPDDRDVLSYSSDKGSDLKLKYKKEINFFEKNLEELSETLIYLVGANNKIVYFHHPHLQHILADENGEHWNHIVYESIKKISDKYNIYFFDSQEFLTNAFGDNPKDYYWNNDMHFNFSGLKLYGEYVATSLFDILNNKNCDSSFFDCSVKEF